MPTSKKKVKTKTTNKNKNKNKNTVIVNVNSNNKRKVLAKSTETKQRYPHSHFGIAPPVHVVVNHITPDQKPMNVAVEKKETNPITHGIGQSEKNSKWANPNELRSARLVQQAELAAKAADARAEEERLNSERMKKGKGEAHESGNEGDRESESDEEVPIKRTPRQIPRMFVNPEDQKPAITSGLAELFGAKRRKSESEVVASSSTRPPQIEQYTGREPFEALLNKYNGLATKEEIRQFCKDVIGYLPRETSRLPFDRWKIETKSTFKKRLEKKRQQWEKEEH
jgi:hypothetical protein